MWKEVWKEMQNDLFANLPSSTQVVAIDSDSVPEFTAQIQRGQSHAPVTIAPPLDYDGRGEFVCNVCAPMASMKSLMSRAFHFASLAITVVVAVRVSYAQNTHQEWREAAPNADEQDAAAREALGDFEELSRAQRCAAEQFGPDAAVAAHVWW